MIDINMILNKVVDAITDEVEERVGEKETLTHDSTGIKFTVYTNSRYSERMDAVRVYFVVTTNLFGANVSFKVGERLFDVNEVSPDQKIPVNLEDFAAALESNREDVRKELSEALSDKLVDILINAAKRQR